MFDGKISMWPFVTYDPAKYNSKNRPKGTIVTKPIASVNKDFKRNDSKESYSSNQEENASDKKK